MQKILSSIVLFLPLLIAAQTKKPLTHDVYDGWQSAGEKKISNNGQYVLYVINPQQGDGTLYTQPLEDSAKRIAVPRGYDAVFTQDSRFVITKIKPFYQDTRQARIKKKKPDEMPKDSLAIINLSNDSIQKISNVKSFNLPEKSAFWLAYHLQTVPLSKSDSAKKNVPKDTIQILAHLSDSIIKKSLKNAKGKISKQKLIEAANKAAKEIYKKAEKDEPLLADAEDDEKPGDSKKTGSDLVLKNLSTGYTKTFKWVADYKFDKQGNTLFLETAKNTKDAAGMAYVAIHHLTTNITDTILSGFNDVKNSATDEVGSQWAFVAERDSSAKSLQKFYKLWYYKSGSDSAKLLVTRNTSGLKTGYNVSENATPKFSKNGTKLFFGIAPVQPPKDTTLVDFETARLDIWHYNDDYIQPQQLKQLPQESKRSFMAVVVPGEDSIIQLGDLDAENISLVNEGNADWVLAQSTKDNRIASNWEGRSKNSAYIISTKNGERKTIQKGLYTFYQASPNGKYVYWYNPQVKHYFTYDISSGKTNNVTKNIPQPIYDIDNDVPDFPRAMGIADWSDNDETIFVKSFYDIWKVSPQANITPVNFTETGKTKNLQFTTIRLDNEKRYLSAADTVLLMAQNQFNKSWSLFTKTAGSTADPMPITTLNKGFTGILKAKNTEAYLLQESDIQSSELFAGHSLQHLHQITDIAAQQQPYNWLTAELVRWKMFDGKMSEGILYKPENFDAKKKYPVIFYFYEKNTDGIYSYKQPAPSASTINIPYFVSNGYLVFDPNIYYKTGQPGQSAYNSVVSAAKYLSKMPWVDSAHMGIQGQSWGGYQVAYLVTRTNMFKAAGAGAPVSNMTSAYGGIRWGTGMVRQFQYEKTQSRIGATLWEKPELYIKNSPLFAVPKINTPLLIMHNDADGAVPWYQGIELFSAMRRLGKKVWLLQYNGEDHNLMERRNRKDLSIRLSQFFDYYLKGAKPASWILHGLPAINKGRSWGLEVEK